MLIYAFAELYPSPYKPYHDVQFADLCEAGHELHVFAFEGHAGEPHPGALRAGLAARTRSLPASVPALPAAAPAVVRRALAHPLATWRTARRVLDAAQERSEAIAALARVLLLPVRPPDLCLVHNLLAQTRLGFLRALYPGVPIALYYHGGELPGVPVPPARRVAAAFAAADVVLTNTESSRRHAIARGCEPGKIVVTPVGFDLREFPEPQARRYRRDGRLHVVTVGRLSEEKGVAIALQALRDLRARGVEGIRYRVVGDGPECKRLHRFVAEAGLGDVVEFAGRVSHEALSREYLAADALLLPSVPVGTWEENQACVAQEAMLFSALAATSRSGGVPESIAPCMKRFSFDPGDPGAIAAALEALLATDAATMAALGAEARRWVEGRYDIRVTNRQILDAVRERDPAPARRRSA